MITLRLDIETYSSVDLIKSGIYKYAESKDFEILLFAYVIDGGSPEILDFTNCESLINLARIKEMLVDPNILKTAYNATFERVCLERYFNIKLDPAQWQCTAIHALYLGLPGYLAGVAKALGVDEQKDTAGKNLIKYFSVPCKPTKVNGGRTRNLPEHAPDKWEKYREYCKQDVIVERAISEALKKYPVPDKEWELWQLDQRINDFGIKLDMTLVENAIAVDEKEKQLIIDKLKKITNLANPNSVMQLKNWLSDQGVIAESITKDTVKTIMTETDNHLVKEVLKLRLEAAKTSVKKYEAMEKVVCQDKRARGILQFYGANRTGRWAGRGVQVHNLPRNYLSDLGLARDVVREGDYDLLSILYNSASDTLSQLIRTAFVPDKGERFIIADFSAIEARVIAWLANEKWRLEVFSTHGKIYEASAAQMFNVPIESINKGSDLRQKGKVAELALGYQGGVGALVAMKALEMGIAEEDLQGIVVAWRTANPNIVKLWEKIGKAAIGAIESKTEIKYKMLKFIPTKDWLFCELPSGRRLSYYKPELRDGNFGNKELTYMGTNTQKQWVRLNTYGGKLVENIVQAIARDCLATAMTTVDQAGYKIVMHVHDEVVVSCSEDKLTEVIMLMGLPIEWAPGLQLRADGFYTDYYCKD